MGSTSRYGRATINPTAPEAVGVCDGCGFLYNLRDLRWQFDWAGVSMINRHIKVCPTCWDKPQEQLRHIILPPDPMPVRDPRPEAEHVDPVSDFTISATMSGFGFLAGALTIIPVPVTVVDRRFAGMGRVFRGTRVLPQIVPDAIWRRRVADIYFMPGTTPDIVSNMSAVSSMTGSMDIIPAVIGPARRQAMAHRVLTSTRVVPNAAPGALWRRQVATDYLPQGSPIEDEMIVQVLSRTALKAIDTTTTTAALLDESGREGFFLWRTGNFASLITLDVREGIYVKANAVASSAGSWVRIYDKNAIHAVWFGLIDSVNDATSRDNNQAAIQAAIDVMLALAAQYVQLPYGRYYCTGPIYLDLIQNIRSGNVSPSSAFSGKLKGMGIGNNEIKGTRLEFSVGGSAEGLTVGRGRGMEVSNMCIAGQTGFGSTRASFPSGGIGIAIAAFGSHYLIENVMVINWRTGIKTGYDGNNLTDSHAYRGCYITQCFTGVWISQNQNFIVALDSCTFGDNTIHVQSNQGPLINVNYGNYSTASAQNFKMTIGSVSALTVAGSNWTFDCTLSVANTPMTEGALDVFSVSLPGFGVVPLSLVAYNSGTRVATLKFQIAWLNTWFTSVNVKTATDIEAEIQATTTLFASEQITMFWGGTFNVAGIHVENSGCVTRFYYQQNAFVGGKVTHFRNPHFNYSITHDGDRLATNNNEAKFKNQQVWPFIELTVTGNVTLEGGMLHGSGFNQLTAEGICLHQTNNAARLIFRDGVELYNMNIVGPSTQFIPGNDDAVSLGWGIGEYDYGPWAPRVSSGNNKWYTNDKANRIHFRGWYPAPDAMGWLYAAQFATYQATLGAIGTYAHLFGSTPYKVIDPEGVIVSNVPQPFAPNMGIARSAHVGASWGQNITVNYSYKGRSNVLTLSDTSAFFAGLRFTLPDTGQGSTATYLCTGVYPALGYITCMRTTGATSGNGFFSAMLGTQTTTYTGTVITQDPFNFAGATSPRLSATGNVPAQIGTAGTDTTPVVTETYLAEVSVPGIMTLTGIALLNGSAVAGNVTVFLADRLGNVLASSASTAAAGTNAYQLVPFSTPYLAFGPGSFYVCVQHNNTGNRFRSHVVGTFGAGKRTGTTYGTLTSNAANVVTTFTTNLGPIASLY